MAPGSQNVNRLKLFDFPTEIRNHIFRLALIEDKPIVAGRERTSSLWYAHPLPPGLVRVCRQARSEAIPIFYGGNIFSLPDIIEVRYWHDLLAKSIESAAKAVNHIAVVKQYQLDRDERFSYMRLLADAKIALRLTDKHTVKIDFSGELKKTCTCALECMARDLVARSKLSHGNLLIFVTIEFFKGDYSIELCRHLVAAQKRTASCTCGSSGTKAK